MRGIGCAWAVGVLVVIGMVPTPGRAGVSTTGDTYDYGSSFYAGYHANTTGGLTIDAGSVVSRSKGYLGYADGSTGTVIVTGAGSKWTTYDLYVGYKGSGTLTVSDGGLVSAKTLYASLSDVYGNGTITVQSGGILDADLSFDATRGLTQMLAFGSGGTLQFTVDGTSTLGVGFNHSGSLRIAEGRSVTSRTGYLGYNASSTGTATITGVGSTWTNSGTLSIGSYGSGTLRVEGGGQVSDSSGYLGFDSGSTGTAVITGAGSTWTNSGYLYAGGWGSGTLRVEAGGQVSSDSGYLGYDSGSTGTTIITGAGSKWTSSRSFYVGFSGSGTLNVAAGGQVTSGSGTFGYQSYLGYRSGSTGTAIITGAGSTWTNSGPLSIGSYGSGTLRVEGGGQVSDSSGSLGWNSGSTGTATVTGAGSKWTNLGELWVGYFGSGTLAVSDGGVVSANTLYASSSDLYGDGTITVQSGGILDADLSFDAAHGTTQGVASFGTGGTLQLATNGTSVLGVGYKRSGSLRIAGGSSATSTEGYLGYNSGSTGTATITGVGSTWTNSGTLSIGSYGSGTLRVEAGGQVSDGYGYLGYDSGSTGTAVITGAGSTWTSSSVLYVGSNGSGTLRVEDGGHVSSGYYPGLSSYLGCNSSSMGTAIITGAGSTWSNASDLYVGYSGSGTLRVEAGGEVSSIESYIGYNSGSSGKVIVTGAGSKWISSSGLHVGLDGSGLFEQSGGTVHAGGISIGGNGSYVLSGGVLEVSTWMSIRGGPVSWQGGQVFVQSLALDGGRMELASGGGKVLKLSSLSIVNGGTLDLADNGLIVQATASTRAAVLQSVAGQVGAARNTQVLWHGAGITSSVAREDGSGLYGLGVILNVDAQGKAIYSVFEGEAVDANSVLVKYTLNGDADLNGVVDGSDYFFIDKGFLSKASGYGNGDFDYNGVIDGSDYFLIDKAYLATHAGGGAAGVNAVPEPGVLGVVMIAAVGLVRRRRGNGQ